MLTTGLATSGGPRGGSGALTGRDTLARGLKEVGGGKATFEVTTSGAEAASFLFVMGAVPVLVIAGTASFLCAARGVLVLAEAGNDSFLCAVYALLVKGGAASFLCAL